MMIQGALNEQASSFDDFQRGFVRNGVECVFWIMKRLLRVLQNVETRIQFL